jgi:hypothetical protein
LPESFDRAVVIRPFLLRADPFLALSRGGKICWRSTRRLRSLTLRIASTPSMIWAPGSSWTPQGGIVGQVAVCRCEAERVLTMLGYLSMSMPTREELLRRFGPVEDPEIEARRQHILKVLLEQDPRCGSNSSTQASRTGSRKVG